MRRILIFALGIVFCLTASAANGQKSSKRRKKHPKQETPATENTNAPDKELYDRALGDIKHGRQEVGRLTLQTLINTYPDSEFLADAKLAIADSYYKEGGKANLTQAISSYKDFIVFFPFLPKAASAQLQVAMAHYKQLEKPDRDRSEARAAEDEFQTFLQKYPNDPLAPQAEQRLRDVQELLAEGDYRIGYYYYVKGSYRAAAGRLITVSNRYPLYSRSDRALWMLANIFEKSEKKDIAATYYARIVKEYPLSGTVGEAKKKLAALGKPIPQPDPVAVARMHKEQSVDRGRATIVHKATGILRTGPDVRTAARFGSPNLQPESEAAGVDILTPGGQTTLGAAPTSGNVTAPVVEVVTPGVKTEGAADSSGEAAPPPGSQPPVTNPPATASDSGSADAPKAGDSGATPPEAAVKAESGTGARPAGTAADSAAKADPAGGDSATKTDGGSGDASAQSKDPHQTDDKSQAADKKKKESTSKKKKGLKKVIPW